MREQITTDTFDGETATAGLSTLDRLLPVWIGLAMVAGILLGRTFPDLNDQQIGRAHV